MKTKIKIIFSPLAFVLAIGLASCVPMETPEVIKVTGISITPTAPVSVMVDATVTLSATVTPSDATNKEIIWSSDTPALASVDAYGVVKGIKAGTATIRAIAKGDNSIMTTKIVTVIAPEPLGSLGNPFKVATVDDLKKVGSDVDGWTLSAHYIQTANINLSSIDWTPIGGWILVGDSRFFGSYNGNNHTIMGLYISKLDADFDEDIHNLGLFRCIGRSGIVKNLKLEYVNLLGGLYVGGIAGTNEGVIQNCSVQGSVTSLSGGGITGKNDGIIRNCSSISGLITSVGVGSPLAITSGGVAGVNSGIIENCYVTVSISGNEYGVVGGISGWNQESGRIINCVALSSIATGYFVIGRIVGYSSPGGILANNYASTTMNFFNYGSGSVLLDKGHDKRDGADVVPADYHGANSATWWPTVAKFSPSSWTFAAYSLPVFKPN